MHHDQRRELRPERTRQVDAAARKALTDLWQRHWPDCPPVGYKLRTPHQDVWVRFHSLPGSKRYAETETETEAEYAVVLERYNTVLDELFAGGDVYVITPVWTSESEVPSSQSEAGYWQSLLVTDDPDPEFRTYCHLFAARRPWRHAHGLEPEARDTAVKQAEDGADTPPPDQPGWLTTFTTALPARV